MAIGSNSLPMEEDMWYWWLLGIVGLGVVIWFVSKVLKGLEEVMQDVDDAIEN